MVLQKVPELQYSRPTLQRCDEKKNGARYRDAETTKETPCDSAEGESMRSDPPNSFYVKRDHII